MSKCTKVKNPCKICLAPVTQKNGLQCQGVCASWVHFTCINYTPGRIKDIKAGLLTITCPCPDCKTTVDREFYKTDGFTCEKAACPAKIPPVCENTKCIANIQNAACGTRASNSSLHRFSEMSSSDTPGDGAKLGSLGTDIDAVCNTVGQLTQQINNLMLKLKDTINTQNVDPGRQKCAHDGPKSLCPKPCYCAENPCAAGKGKGKRK